ncbi:MAG: inositol monophosphatase family protein [Gemmatimonadaceae bacterium]
MNETPETLMQAAADVARIAGDIALGYFRSRLTVERKPDGSEVTVADRAAERAARDWIEARFPDDGILGEEMGDVRDGARRRWILDPIDGTTSFVRGVPLWGTLVAVADGEDVIAGAAYCPAVDELAVAASGCGCWWNGARCRVSVVAALDAATVLTSGIRMGGTRATQDAWSRLVSAARVSRTWGDCYGYLLVATGRAEVMADGRMKAWDSAAVMPLVVEAGGVFTDWTGVATAFGGNAIATNAALAGDVRRLLSGSAS